MMGELLNLDVVSFPTYDGGQAASTAVMMSHRINGRGPPCARAHESQPALPDGVLL